LEEELEPQDTLAVQDEPKSSARLLSQLEQWEKAYRDWNDICDAIDDIYSRRDQNNNVFMQGWADGWKDAELDLFWASYEILKPAVYAHAPTPVVSPQFKDRRRVKNVTAELLERTAISAFDRSNIDDVMCDIRDDLIFTNRGVMWITYETEDGQKVCFEQVDRKDFRHSPARKWCDVYAVARRVWMTKKDMRKRFRKSSGDAYQNAAQFKNREDITNGAIDNSKRASVWEVWHKADKKVYWVAEGVDVILDSSEPYLTLNGFFPCPKPAYGTLARRSLVPVPDYERYSSHFGKINTLTSRIYLLLDKVKMKGLIPSGGDVATAVQALINAEDDEILIPVPSAQFAGGTNGFVQWMPINEVATAIQGLITARAQLIDDFYQLSGISDIMRGATEAEETLGAQQLKSQYGSVRVRQKIQEMQRIACDAVKIASEIIAEKFSEKTLLEMSQMEIPTKADIEKQIKGIEKAAEQEMKALADKAQQAAESGQIQDPQAAQQEFQQAQQQLLAKYAPMLNEARNEVPIEDIIKLLRDDKARSFAFQIDEESTVLADEAAEKQSRNEFMAAFATASQALMPLVQMGPEGAKLAGGMLKFQLGPFRVGRELDALIDEWIDSVANMPPQNGDSENQELVAAQNKLAEAEMEKAKAQQAKVAADTQLKMAENERKMAELQAKAAKEQADLQIENGKLQLQMSKQEQEFAAKMAELDARQNLMQAQTAEILAKIGLDVRKQDLEEYKAANADQQQQVDTALKVSSEGRAERGEKRADRQQDFNERSTDRQMTMAERQAQERE
jgi:hypothetical protein